MSTDASVERATPQEVFALLGNDTRMEILHALMETPDESVGFSELRRRVGERDSGKFNYHLSQLSDNFVRKTDGGYTLTLAGKQIVGALLAGTYTTSVDLEPIPIDAECRDCNEPLEAVYQDERVTVRCSACNTLENRHTFPPGTIEQFEREELPLAFDRWLRADFQRIVAGFCPNCSGRMDGYLAHPDAVEPVEGFEFDTVLAKFECGRCGSMAHSHVVMPLLFHPAGISFFYDHGIDLTSAPSWETSMAGDWDITTVTDDPMTARLAVQLDDEELVATLDESLAMTDVDRHPV